MAIGDSRRPPDLTLTRRSKCAAAVDHCLHAAVADYCYLLGALRCAAGRGRVAAPPARNLAIAGGFISAQPREDRISLRVPS